MLVHHHRIYSTIVQEATAPSATAEIFIRERNGDIRVCRTIYRCLTLHLRYIDVSTTITARIRLVLITRTNLQRLRVRIGCIFIVEKVVIVTNDSSLSRMMTRILRYTVTQPDITLVRFDRRLVLVRRLGIGDVHHRRTDMVVGIDVCHTVFRATVCIVTCDVHRIVEEDMSITKVAGNVQGGIRIGSS